MHPLDEWDAQQEKSQKAFMEKALYDASLVYQVFSTDAGKQLVDRWKEVLMYSPTANAGLDSISIGMNEGYKAFIRSIIHAVKIQEDESK